MKYAFAGEQSEIVISVTFIFLGRLFVSLKWATSYVIFSNAYNLSFIMVTVQLL